MDSRTMADPASLHRIVGFAGPLSAVILLGLPSPALQAGDVELTDAERRGKQIYLEGTSPSDRRISVAMGEQRLPLPARAATCGGCHGHDGTGRPESGINPYNVTWKYLTKSYGHVHEGGLEHGPFTPESLKDYLRTGVYPGGRRGDPSMPVYDMSDEDLDDLVAYLQRLGDDVDPGIGSTTITVATVVPSAGPSGEIGGAIRQLLEAYVADVNRHGGIYGRRLELVVHELEDDSEAASGVLRTWLAAQRPFALVSPFTPGLEPVVSEAAATEEILLIGPWTLYPVDTFSENRHVFYLYSGLAEQVAALVRYAGERLALAEPGAAILAADTTSEELVEGVHRACREAGWHELPIERYPVGGFDAPATVQRLRAAGAEVVVSLAVDHELRSFLESAAVAGWTPYVLAPGVLAGDLVVAAPAPFSDRLMLSYPTLPKDRTSWGTGGLSRLLADVEAGPSQHLHAMISAYSAATVFTEALRRAGRKLGRRELTGALERFYRFETGLTPPITYTNNRRIGAKGAYVIAFQSATPDSSGEFLRTAPWIDLE
jgi:ABC-type branched-subunit amino acid transport system substrate-binding protein